MNRLTNAASGNNLGETISYDVMGNITSLTRDNFGTNNYTGYDGNRLTAISGFTNSTYSYDVNGNQKTNTARGITNIDYNYLNLPVAIAGPNVNYTYTAAGEKLQKQAGGTTTNYIDGIQYTNNSIDFIQTEEGLARRSGSSYSYEYNLSDHLGNVRATFYQNPNTNQLEVLQRDDYYAFGLRKEPVAKAGLNRYLYNGKELQEELGQYDYGARFYDPVIGRWNVIDPLAEQGRRFSSYEYAINNPMRFNDPDGMQEEDKVKKKPKPPRHIPLKPINVKKISPTVKQDGTASTQAVFLASKLKLARTISASTANKGFTQPPYKAGTRVAEIKSPEGAEYARVYTEGSNGTEANGRWLTKASEIEGLSPSEIQSKLALPNEPTNIVRVQPPSGTLMRVGITGPAFGQPGGGIQYQLMERIPAASFIRPMGLPMFMPPPIVEPMIPELPIIEPLIIP